VLYCGLAAARLSQFAAPFSVELSYARGVACLVGPNLVPPRNRPGFGKHLVTGWRFRRTSGRCKVLQGKGRVVGETVVQRLGLADLSRGEDRGLLTGVDLVGRQHAQGGRRVQVVVPGAEASEAGHRGWDAGERAGIDRLGFDRAEESVDTCTGRGCKCARTKRVIGRPRPAEVFTSMATPPLSSALTSGHAARVRLAHKGIGATSVCLNPSSGGAERLMVRRFRDGGVVRRR
jgi:hypothetical protein